MEAVWRWGGEGRGGSRSVMGLLRLVHGKEPIVGHGLRAVESHRQNLSRERGFLQAVQVIGYPCGKWAEDPSWVGAVLPRERTGEDTEEGLSSTEFLRLIVCDEEGLRDRFQYISALLH
ncbi:hypothetical protein SLA2020_447630 [Shorea laevis]